MRKFLPPRSSSLRILMTRRRTRKVPLRAVTNPRTLPRATILRQLAMCRTNHHNLMIVAMWVSLEQMATSHHHLLKTIPLSLLTALRPKVKPMASRLTGSSMSRHLLSMEDSSHSSLTAIKDSPTTAIRSLTATTTRTAINNRLRTQECDLHRQTIPKDVYRYRTARQAETTF